VAVQPLSENQVYDYLVRGGEPLRALRVAVQEDAALRELTNTPLMLRHRGAEKTYTVEQTRHWLSWLARQLKQHNQTVFYLERLQPDWLPTQQFQQHYQLLVKGIISTLFGLLIGGMLGGLIGGLLIARNVGHIATEVTGILAIGLPLGMVGGLLAGFIGLAFSKRAIEIHPSEILTWSWSSIWYDLLEAVAIGLVGGLIFWRIGGPFVQLTHPPVNFLVDWLIYQLGGILIGGIMGLLLFGMSTAWLGFPVSKREGWRFMKNAMGVQSHVPVQLR
jgi:hypothetical protein